MKLNYSQQTIAATLALAIDTDNAQTTFTGLDDSAITVDYRRLPIITVSTEDENSRTVTTARSIEAAADAVKRFLIESALPVASQRARGRK